MNAVTGLLVIALLGAEAIPSNNEATPREKWELTLSEAVRIGLANAENVRILCERVEEDDQVYVTIAPREPAVSRWQFKAETMALVHAIEQQYWALSYRRTQLAAEEHVVKTARQLVAREQTELPVAVASVGQAKQRLEEFQLGLRIDSTEVAAVERKLCVVLGLPEADKRQIVPVTPPTTKEVKPEWDVVRNRTHWRNRFVLEVDASYRQWQAGSRVLAAAGQRLATQRTDYDEGRIPIDRYFDVLSQYASAISQEADFRAKYNVCLATMEEVKGTLLDSRQITVADPPATPERIVPLTTEPRQTDPAVTATRTEGRATRGSK